MATQWRGWQYRSTVNKSTMSCAFEGEYHDVVWGTPVTDSRDLFAQLSLCTQQCGVSWRIVWNKRHFYEAAFKNWDMRRVAAMSDADLDHMCDKHGPWVGKVMLMAMDELMQS